MSKILSPAEIAQWETAKRAAEWAALQTRGWHPHTYPAGATTCTHCGLHLTKLAEQIHGRSV